MTKTGAAGKRLALKRIKHVMKHPEAYGIEAEHD
jgi:hypothetical protein